MKGEKESMAEVLTHLQQAGPGGLVLGFTEWILSLLGFLPSPAALSAPHTSHSPKICCSAMGLLLWGLRNPHDLFTFLLAPQQEHCHLLLLHKS